jgi:dienelactone hydrolase
MAEVVLFHHAQGLTDGVRRLADAIAREGHTVHTPDVFEGLTFETTDEGVAHAKEIGFGEIAERGRTAVAELTGPVVYAGISLGVMSAQELAQTMPEARGAVLFSGCFPPEEFGGPWPADVPAQIHMKDADEFVLEGDLEAAQTLAAETPGVELFLYEGNQHLFVDDSTGDHDPVAAELALERTLRFLAELG